MPGRGRPFQRGNPGGRPRIVGDVRELARRHTQEAVDTLTAIMGDIARHWGRGLVIAIILALVVGGTGIISITAVGIVFLIAEMFLGSSAEAFDQQYFELSVVALTCLLAPYTISTGWEGLVEGIGNISVRKRIDM